jgi:hypothetical protein
MANNRIYGAEQPAQNATGVSRREVVMRSFTALSAGLASPAIVASFPGAEPAYAVDVVPPSGTNAQSVVAADLDAELVDLERRYFQLSALEEAADENYNRCAEAYREPGRPDALRHRIEDHTCGLNLPRLSRHDLSADITNNAFYTEREVELVRHAPPPWNLEALAEQQARIAEIEVASEAWLDVCEVAREASGLGAAEAAVEKIVSEKRSVAMTIATTPARTMVGIEIRMRILSHIYDDEFADLCAEEIDEDSTTEELMRSAILRDLLGILS